MTLFVCVASISLLQFLFLWLPLSDELLEYTDWGNDVIWITKNRELNWFFTHFLQPHALMYERLCERVNGNGLALLLLLLTLVTLPVTLLMSLIGFSTLLVRYLWRTFCRAFARKDEKE